VSEKTSAVEPDSRCFALFKTFRTPLLEDYRSIYGEDPPRINAVAIMTDTDDTNSKAVSFFGDISFHRE